MKRHHKTGKAYKLDYDTGVFDNLSEGPGFPERYLPGGEPFLVLECPRHSSKYNNSHLKALLTDGTVGYLLLGVDGRCAEW